MSNTPDHAPLVRAACDAVHGVEICGWPHCPCDGSRGVLPRVISALIAAAEKRGAERERESHRQDQSRGYRRLMHSLAIRQRGEKGE